MILSHSNANVEHGKGWSMTIMAAGGDLSEYRISKLTKETEKRRKKQRRVKKNDEICRKYSKEKSDLKAKKAKMLAGNSAY
ncbi:hypothetical protein PR048_001034 [Dryococelus australis]|uniref:Uncharacterized protein n=1 Tax=Dryococelus australis TaxID=614101 RepID=A0ABQ9IG86_9NEOP|nr:hypothetical protein PR048_001034 [Dryococelus australis]